MPETQASPVLRWLRAGVVAGVAATLGAVAHLLAGGLLPSPPALVLLGATLLVVTAAALGRPASYRLLAALVVGGQAVVHVMLTAAAGHGTRHPAPAPTTAPQPAAPTPPGRTYLDVMDPAGSTGVARTTATGTPHWLEHLREDLTGPHLLMALAHLAAAAAVAGWLYAGERALWTLVALLGRRLTRAWSSPSPAPVPAPTFAPCASAGASDSGWSRALRYAVSGGAGRRGPPRVPGIRLSGPPAAA